MRFLFFVMISLAAAVSSGCASKQSEEYQKEVDAVPMPRTETERLEQCRYFNSRILSVSLESARKQQEQLMPSMQGFSQLPFAKRIAAMNCSKKDTALYPEGF
ncbi:MULTISPECIES: hypothetical protein [unclassified Pseudomonas]|uniref:hypothetical protein n=1 Tax=unclassified Pseudomonas TaxID=196821 RepID=UPI000CD31B0E|nr:MULTISPECIES: hypothetical protein [unclassified Pseudomonas]POA50827.1 hypothetical protein C1889_30000 [Pseudomonas sp. FW507-12TSA]